MRHMRCTEAAAPAAVDRSAHLRPVEGPSVGVGGLLDECNLNLGSYACIRKQTLTRTSMWTQVPQTQRYTLC